MAKTKTKRIEDAAITAELKKQALKEYLQKMQAHMIIHQTDYNLRMMDLQEVYASSTPPQAELDELSVLEKSKLWWENKVTGLNARMMLGLDIEIEVNPGPMKKTGASTVK